MKTVLPALSFKDFGLVFSSLRGGKGAEGWLEGALSLLFIKIGRCVELSDTPTVRLNITSNKMHRCADTRLVGSPPRREMKGGSPVWSPRANECLPFYQNLDSFELSLPRGKVQGRPARVRVWRVHIGAGKRQHARQSDGNRGTDIVQYGIHAVLFIPMPGVCVQG